MIESFEASEIVFFSLMIPVLAGVLTLFWGRVFARQGDWLVSISFAFALMGLLLAGFILSLQGFKPQLWQTGWIWPRLEMGSITVGVMTDPLGLAIAGISIFAAIVLLSQRNLLRREPRVDRVYAGIGFSFAGVALAWFSLTPWFALIGLVIAVFGGFVALGARWDSSVGARVATRFAWERMSGILLMTLGTCGLAASRSALSWNPSVVTTPAVATDFFAAILLVSGAFVQCQPFPLLGWLAAESETLTSVRSILAQVAPAVAGFALLFRMEPELRRVGIFPGFGWVCLISALLALAMGLFQGRWKVCFGTWLSAGFSAAVAALAFAGQWSGLSLLMGTFMGSIGVATIATAALMDAPRNGSTILRGRWMKAVGLLGMGSATGMVGAVSVGGIIRWLAYSWEQPFQMSVIFTVVFLFILLGWKLLWKLMQAERPVDMSWLSILCVFVFTFSSLAVFWTGSVTGTAFPWDLDQIFSSRFKSFLFEPQPKLPNEGVVGIVSWIFWGLLPVALGLAFWLARRTPSKSANRFTGKLRKLISTGYGIDPISRHFMRAVVEVGRSIEKLVDQKIWSDWIPHGLASMLRRLSSSISNVDTGVYRKYSVILKNGVEAPAKALQFLQNGDVQWYLLCAIGSGIAILIFFMKF